MRKITTIFISLAMLFVFALPVKAITDQVSIADLSDYTTTDNFKLSYTALSDSSPSVKFFVRKDGESYAEFVSTTGYSGEVQVTGSQIQEQAKYFFKVEINGGTAIDETSVTYDVSGPSPVQNYWKEHVSPGFFRLHWKNPGDTDFSRVFIYRSTNTNFTADGSTKIGERGGSYDADMTFEDMSLDPNTTYYYALRAVDKAGNASSLVADPEVSATITEETVVIEGEGVVTTLPKEEAAGGQVLGEEEDTEEIASPSPSTEPTDLGGAYQEAKTRLFGTARGRLIAVSAVVVGIIAYFIFRKRGRNRDY